MNTVYLHSIVPAFLVYSFTNVQHLTKLARQSAGISSEGSNRTTVARISNEGSSPTRLANKTPGPPSDGA